MKYIFFGTPEFATTILQKLIEADMPPLALVCNPDRPQGRKKIITPPPVKQRIMNYELGIREKRPGGVVLDPYTGSGSTCAAAKLLGRKYLGIELVKRFQEVASGRLDAYVVTRKE